MTSVSIDRLQGLNSSEALKIPVATVTTAAITLSGTQTVNGVALIAGDDVLVNNQSDQTTNGIYTVATGAWTRRPDFDGPNDAVTGTIIFVNSDNAGLGPRFWRLSVSDNPVIIGTTHIIFAVVSLETDASIAAVAAYVAQAAAIVTEAETLTSSIFSGTSDTSLAVSTGSRSFVTQAGKAFSGFVVAYSSANHANYMHGTVTSYSGTALTVNVLDSGGSGTHTDWIIAISSPQGTPGNNGDPGPAGTPATETGDIIPSYRTTKTGYYLLINSCSIGSATSGATYAESAAQALYTLMWTNVLDASAPVAGGRGANAAADWAANKAMTLPPWPGRTPIGAGSGSGLTTRVLGTSGGEEAHTQTEAEMFPHTHPIDQIENHTDGATSGTAAIIEGFGTATTGSTGGGDPFNVMQPWTAINWFIKN